jgi:CPA2 family monovalent cation:H+ antiporter-2
MDHLSPLIQELTLILLTAGAVTILFKWLKQPAVLGYVVAGIILSFFITKENPEYENIETWAEIGVIFLLFGLGLEFSFKKLLSVGSIAFVAALFMIITEIGMGYLTGRFFGWSPIASFFLGAMICMSSTIIIIKVIDDLKLTKKNFAGIVFGVLIIEDLVAVLLMVLLSTIAISNHVEGTEMLLSMFKLLSFLLFWFILGTYLIPTFLRKMKRFLNDETLLIVSLALCLGMVLLATRAGFSEALGAFIMGSILAETIDSERIEHLIMPIKNLFAAIFFVSVGLMVQITSLGTYIFPVLVISVVALFGKTVLGTVGVLLSGQDLNTSTSAGFSLSPMGEFSYIIGALGLSLGVIKDSLYQIVVLSSVITMFAMPYMVGIAEPFSTFLEKKLPSKWQNFFNKNVSGAHPLNQDNLWKKLLKEMATNILIFYLISVMVVNFSLVYAVTFVQEWFPGIKGNLLTAAVTLLIIAPLLRAVIIKKNRSVEYTTLWNDNKSYRGPLIFTIIFRVFLCAGLIMYLLFELFHVNIFINFTLTGVILILITFSQRTKSRSKKMESRFKENLNEKEKHRELKAPLTKGFVNHVLERDLHLSDFAIEPYFSIVGKTLKELNFRQLFGVSIVKIVRGPLKINVPKGNERIYPGDHIIVLGTDKQMELFQNRLEEKRKKYENIEEHTAPEVKMHQFQIGPESRLIGETIRTSGIQEIYHCLVIGIERGDTSIQDPNPDLVLEENDIVWLIGEYNNILKICEL